MTQLSDTQAIILSAAAQRSERIALPLPDSLRGGAAAKVVSTMIAKGLLQEVEVNARRGEPVWREAGDGHGTTLVATDAGLAAIGIEPDDADTARPSGTEAPPQDTAQDGDAKAAHSTRTPRAGTKQAALIAMLRCAGRRDHRGDHHRHRLAGPHGARRDRRSAEEEARSRRDLGEGRGARSDLPDRLTRTSQSRRGQASAAFLLSWYTRSPSNILRRQ